MTTNHSRHTTAAADGPGTRYPVRPDGPATPPRRRRAVVTPRGGPATLVELSRVPPPRTPDNSTRDGQPEGWRRRRGR